MKKVTERLFDADSHLRRFTARVISCESAGELWRVELDRTAFFPAGGGQAGDVGMLDGAAVRDTVIEDGRIFHIADRALPIGGEVSGELDWETRFRRMQNHSGEHIVSGLVHRAYGYENVGFHMSAGEMTVDFSGELSFARLREIELAANRVVAENRAVRAEYPDAETLAKTDYRSKLELTENVRLVTIEGADVCACCAPHVNTTGEVGLIKILACERHRGGVRVHLVCGMDALEEVNRRLDANSAVSNALSAPPAETAAAVERLLTERDELKQEIWLMKKQRLEGLIAALEDGKKNLCLFAPELDTDSLRALVNAGVEKCSGICAAFSGTDGDWKYIIGSRGADLRAMSREINAAIAGRGGGRPEMIQGSAKADRETIQAYFENL